jgi:hypothetical protein
LYQQGVLSPKYHKRTRRRLIKELREKQHQQQLLSKAASQTLSALQHEEVSGTWRHPTKPRSTYFGQRIEMDASSYAWIAGLGIQNMHVAIDDASGELVGLWLEDQETLHGYYKITEQLLSKHGIPVSIRTDKRSVFIYEQSRSIEGSPPTQTQFASACSRLGIDLSCNSDPDFKPKVERVHQSACKAYFHSGLHWRASRILLRPIHTSLRPSSHTLIISSGIPTIWWMIARSPHTVSVHPMQC